MGLKKNSPGCTCCGDNCSLLSDTFDRADDTDIGDDWTEDAGDWSIASNHLSISSANAIALATVSPPAVNGVSIAVTVTVSQSGDTARLIFNYVDSDNYNFVEFEFGGVTAARIYERIAGTNTLLRSAGHTGTVGFPLNVLVCYYNGLIILNDDGVGISTTLDGGSFGLGTGALTGTVLYDSFIATKTGDDCPDCNFCDGGCIDATPGMMEVTCSGIVGGFCTAGNGTFILENPHCPFANTTRWLYGTTIALNTFPHWELRIRDNGASGSPRRDITLIYRQTSTRSIGFLLQDFAATDGYDCPLISGLNIPFSSSTNCGAITPTVTLRAV